MFQNSEGAEAYTVQVSFLPRFQAPLPRSKREPSFLGLLPETLCIFCMVASHVHSPPWSIITLWPVLCLFQFLQLGDNST